MLETLSPKLTSFALVALFLAACQSQLDGKPTAVVQEAAPAATLAGETPTAPTTLALNAEASKIEFVGAKVTADHRGSFGQPSGEAKRNADGEIVGLEVRVDTTKVDIEPEKLEQHLRSPDFFDVERYPEAQFQLTSIEKKAGSEVTTHLVSGDLELHGTTRRITFPASVELHGGRIAASASFKIDRTDFGIVYEGMADDLIKNEVLLEMDLHFTAERDGQS
jgi:polyisoprenoid-binding protein YceI